MKKLYGAQEGLIHYDRARHSQIDPNEERHSQMVKKIAAGQNVLNLPVRRIFVLLIFFLQTILLWAEMPVSYQEVVDQEPALAELLTLFDIPKQSISEVQIKTSLLWMQAGKERWDFDTRYEDSKDLFWPLFEELHLLEPLNAKKIQYDYALIHGATLSIVEMRLDFLISEWNRGIRFKTLVFLTGRRPLLPMEFEKVGLPYETDMVKWVYEKASMPIEMRDLPVVFVDAPDRELPNGLRIRPCTEDTIRTWLSMNPQPGSCLAVSNQPYTCYQDASAKRLFPDPFTIETIGCGTTSFPKVSLLLDTLAKWLNQMK